MEVRPEFLPEHSRPDQRKYVFGYRVTITNEGVERAQLISRKWLIVDGAGRRHEVAGEGVVGHQPDLGPGQHFEYTSYCPIETAWGTMEGAYTLRSASGEMFDIEIRRFFLVSSTPA